MFLKLFFLLQLPLLSRAAELGGGKNKAEAKGVLLLDSISYPLVVEELKPETRILIGIFDKKQTFTEEPLSLEAQARFNYLHFALSYARDPSTDLNHLLFAQIVVNGGENKYLKKRLVGDRPLPIFVVLGENKTDPYVVDLDLRDYRYCTFISLLNSYAGYNNTLPGILAAFDELVVRFIPASREGRLELIDEAKKLYETIDDKRIISDADYYLTTMQKVMEEGIQYVKEEGGRLIARARLPKVNDDRKYNFDKKLNILESFLKNQSGEPIREASYPYINTQQGSNQEF